MSALKNTPLVEYHIELGAKMTPFAGWNMPVQYPGGILSEHRHTRKYCSVFDICHMGEFRIAGPKAVGAMDGLLARPCLDLPVGKCRYNLLLNDDGGVLDDLIVYRMAEDDLMIVVNAGNIASDMNWIEHHLPLDGAEFHNLSDLLAKLDLQGPQSAEVLGKLGVDPATLPGYFHWKSLEIDGIRCIVSRTGYTGELGYEIYFNAEYTDQLWDLLLSTEPVAPAGLGARDTLRLEMGYSLYGHELLRERTPIECGLSSLLQLDSPREFIGKAALLERRPERKQVAVKLDSRRAARAGNEVLNAKEERIGVVTSGAFCPSLDCAAALCSIDVEIPCAVGDTLWFDVGNTKLSGTVAELPFYRAGSLRNDV